MAARCPLLPFLISSPNYGRNREEWVGVSWGSAPLEYCSLCSYGIWTAIRSRSSTPRALHVWKSCFSSLTSNSFFVFSPIKMRHQYRHNQNLPHSSCVALSGLLPYQSVVFHLRSRRSSHSVRVFASTPMLSVLLGAGSGAWALRGPPAADFVNSAILRWWRFTLGVFPFLLLICHLL